MTIAASFGLRVEIAFSSTADAVTPTWTDVTAYLDFAAGVSISHGRQDEMGQVGAGTCAFVLDNTDGRFTPGNMSSPYSPGVRLRRKVRVSWRDPNVGSGAYVDRFVGYIDDWDTSHPSGSSLWAACRVSASDRIKRLSSASGLRSHIEQEILADAPSAYWPLGDQEPVTSPRDLIGSWRVSPMVVRHSGTGGEISWSGTGPADDGLTAPMFAPVDASNGYWLSADSQNFGLSATVECTVLTSATSGRVLALCEGLDYADVVLDGGYAKLRTVRPNRAISNGSTSTAYLADGRTHHVALVMSSGGAALYVDGVSVATLTGWSAQWPQIRVGGDGENGMLFGCTVSHVAVHTGVLSAARILEHAKAVSGFVTDTPGDRVARFARWAGVPSGELSLATGDEPAVGSFDVTGKSPWDAMQFVATTEGGVLYVDRSGVLTLTARSVRINTTSALTLSAASEQVGPGIRPVCNDAHVINAAEVKGSTATAYASDAASIAELGEYRASVETAHPTANSVQSWASWLVGRYATPQTRLEDLSIDLQTDSASRAGALALEIGSRVTVTGLPAAFPASTMDVIVEGWQESIGPDSWDLSLSTSPADTTVYWVLAVAGKSELATTTTLAH